MRQSAVAGAALVAVRLPLRGKKIRLFGLTTDRTAPNPAYPPLQVDHVNNRLVINVLHTSPAGAGGSKDRNLRIQTVIERSTSETHCKTNLRGKEMDNLCKYNSKYDSFRNGFVTV